MGDPETVVGNGSGKAHGAGTRDDGDRALRAWAPEANPSWPTPHGPLRVLPVIRYEHRTSIRVDMAHRLARPEFRGDVYDGAVMFVVSQAAGRDQSAGHPAHLWPFLAAGR